MKKDELINILNNYSISDIIDYREIDTTNGDDYRVNIVVDKKYVLRINNDVITEERLQSVSRLCERYRSIGVLAPKLYKNKDGVYLTSYQNHVCYLSEYLDYSTEEDATSCNHKQVEKEVLKMIGIFSKKYSNYDLSDINSMWSLIDLAPLDINVDEKQENLDMLVKNLDEIGESNLAKSIVSFNEKNRNEIKKVYKQLPRCVIQGDLNCANILVKDTHFIGLIDFNMAGTEVNVNYFCAETNGYISKKDFLAKSAFEFYSDWILEQNCKLAIIMKEYALNELEKGIIENYRNICMISQYPNVMAFINFLKEDKAKTLDIIRLILER